MAELLQRARSAPATGGGASRAVFKDARADRRQSQIITFG